MPKRAPFHRAAHIGLLELGYTHEFFPGDELEDFGDPEAYEGRLDAADIYTGDDEFVHINQSGQVEVAPRDREWEEFIDSLQCHADAEGYNAQALALMDDGDHLEAHAEEWETVVSEDAA